MYNVFFTAWPIIIYAVFDQEHLKTDLIKFPLLYSIGMKENYLSWGKYFKTVFEAMFLGIFIFLVGYVYFDSALGDDG